ncbi:GAG-pre-integrase domain-containing protein, partial [Micrococcus luteus]
MTGLKDLLTNYRIINGGYVAFAGDKKGGKMIGQGEVSNGSLTLEDVNYVPELAFNLLSVSQICDKNIPVLFLPNECLFLKPEFSIPEELVIMRAPRRNDTYMLNMGSKESTSTVTCLLSKASSFESFQWHRRLGHINFKILNKLVKNNLVRGLPLKDFSVVEKCMACAKGKQHKKPHKLKIENSIQNPSNCYMLIYLVQLVSNLLLRNLIAWLS